MFKKINKYDKEYKKKNHFIHIWKNYKTTFHLNCIHKFLNNELSKINKKLLYNKKNLENNIIIKVGYNSYKELFSLNNSLENNIGIYFKVKNKEVENRNYYKEKTGEKNTLSINELKKKSILNLNSINNINNTSNKMNKIKFRNFTNIPLSAKKDKNIKFSKLNLCEMLNFINKNLSKERDEKIWNNIFIQIDKLTSKESKNEEYKRELYSFFAKLTNNDYYNLLNNLKDLDENTKNNICNSIFFECFALSLKNRDVTYSFDNYDSVNELKEQFYDVNEKQVNENGDISNRKKKNESKVKYYMKNIKSFLNLTSTKKNAKDINLENTDIINKNKLSDSKNVDEKRIDDITNSVEKKLDNNNIQNNDNDVNIKNVKNVKMIKKWFHLLNYFSSKSENMLIIKDYLNKIFRKNINELIHLNYFSKTVHYLTNQINSKSIHAIILAYEKKLEFMKPYDFSYSLIILLRFLILNHNLFNNIIDDAIIDPLNKFKNEKYFIRFIKSVDNYPLIYPSNLDYNNSEFFQGNMNDLYNFTFSIFIRKLSIKLKYYSLNNLLFLSECLSKVIFMSTSQNQTLHIFINKLRYYIDQHINLQTVDNYMLIRLFKISSFFSFVPEMEVYINNSHKNVRIKRNFISNQKTVKLLEDGNSLKNKENREGDTKHILNKSYPYNENEKKENLEFSEDMEVDNISSNINKNVEQIKKNYININETMNTNNNIDQLMQNCDEKYKNEEINEKHIIEKIENEEKNMDNKKILKYKNEIIDDKNKKKNICFNLNDEKNINYYEKIEESDSVNFSNFLTSYDLFQKIDNSFQINNYILNYNIYNDINKKHKKNKFLLKNIVLLLCSQIDKSLDEIIKKENKLRKSKNSSILRKEELIKEIKLINEKSEIRNMNIDNSTKNDIYHSYENNKLYNDYLIFYDIGVLSDIVNFTHFSININKHTYELIKSIKKRLMEIVEIYNFNKGENHEKKMSEHIKIKNIRTFQLYNFYCACKNFSPSFLFGFFDILLKLTPKIKIIDIDKNDLFNKKIMHKLESLETFEKVWNKNISISFIVSLLHSLKIIISSNLFHANNLLNEHINIMVQYSYYVLLYYYYNKYLKKNLKNFNNVQNKKEELGDYKKNEKLFGNDFIDGDSLTYHNLNETTKRKQNINYSYVKDNINLNEEKSKNKDFSIKELHNNGQDTYENNDNNNYDKDNNYLGDSNLKENILKSSMNDEKVKNENLEDYNYYKNDYINTYNSDSSTISSIIKTSKKNKKFCIFEELYLEDLCNIYLCLSTSLYFLNRAEEKSSEIKHLIYLENKFLELISKVKYMKYLSDNFIFFLFKGPYTYKLEQKFDSIIPSLKIINKKKKKKTEILSSFTSSQNIQLLSLPAATAFFLCKIKLSMSNGNKENNVLRIENTKKLYEILMNDYKLLSNCIEQLYINKRNDGDNMKNSVDYVKDNILQNQSEEVNNPSIKFNKNKCKYSHLPYFTSNKISMNENIHFINIINDMFFGVHEVKTLYDLQNTLLKTVKHLETAQINLNVNHKFTQIKPIHNDVLICLSELSKVVKECLYTIFLSQPYIHKSPKKYSTKRLVNYFINKCKFVRDYNIFDDCNNKSFNELKNHKYITNEI
ncbi:conserved Plasmodium protein, unknown function [Plasmodium gallinaceum]|uniref:Uncharacterized protein n=1 Tax=Plasmodium gallinaceum TaxID=5849 RepID=A0A1J1GMM9_PLAGA|nr:conserved Plasmodium protein, unknown function [Plasmodium gallinaceum]CRG93620.1 conserved Plasmodium protein, unknown function [Plasmodium gallinaceum]